MGTMVGLAAAHAAHPTAPEARPLAPGDPLESRPERRTLLAACTAERDCDGALAPAAQAANSRRLWPSTQALLDTVFGVRLKPGETEGIDKYLQPPSK